MHPKDSYFMLGITEGLALMTEEDFRVESLEDHFYQYLGIKRTEKTIQKTEISNEIASQTGIKRTIKINSQKSTPFMTDNPLPTIMTNTQIKIVDIKPELGSHLESVGKNSNTNFEYCEECIILTFRKRKKTSNASKPRF